MPDPTPVDLRADGFLWLINRTCFHPRGFTLAYDGDRFTLTGTGGEPWRYDRELVERDLYAAVEAAFARARQEQAGEPGSTPTVAVDPGDTVAG